MTRFLIYLLPAIADMIVAAMLFVCSNRFADAGKSRTEVAMVFTAWAAVYIVSNQVLARFVNSRNAAVMMIIGNLLFTVTSVGSVIIENVCAMYVGMMVMAIAAALFFLPFQVFMKAVEPSQQQGVVRSVAIYTFSWSLGFAGGPFIAGFLYQWLNWRWCFAFTGLLGLLTVCGVQLLKHHAKYHRDEAITTNQPAFMQPSCNAEDVNYYIMPDLAWLGWVVGGVGCLGNYALLSLLPSIGVFFTIPKSQIGSMIASLYVVQAFIGLSLLRGKMWMFRPVPVMGFAVFGLVGMAAFGVSLLPLLNGIEVLTVPLRTLGLYTSVACYGVFSGSFFFGLVFHSLVHPHRSAQYVAINETVVGICGVVGPILAGTLADRSGFVAVPIALITMLTCTSILQFAVLKRLPSGKILSRLNCVERVK